jgi:hypothetical protein
MKKYIGKTGVSLRAAPIAIAVVGLLCSMGSVKARNIESDNPDIKMSWDTTVRYNAAWRVKERDPGLANNLAQDESNALFDKGNLITNRLDLFSEFDLKYKNVMGFRLSGQAWGDGRYGSRSKALAGTTVAQQNIKGTFNDETRRYYAGPSGEFLDTFVWAKGKIAEAEVVGRVGRHALLWGESLIGNTQAISYGQAPNDGRKSVQSPGASAKETALPINQITGTVQFLDNASLSWQYGFEWKPNRLSLGGTYVGFDAFSSNISGGIPRVAPEEGRAGPKGLMLKWTPEALGADLGLVYRKFDDTNPWAAQLNATATDGRYVYARNIELLGLSFNKTIFDIAVGAEISHRKGMALNTLSGNAGVNSRYEGPIGDTWHALLNGTALWGKNSIWDTASLAVELQYARLDRVTKNGQFYKSQSNAAAVACAPGRDEVLNGCSTKDFWNLGLVFTPVWQQVLPSTDISLATTYIVGLKGTAPTNGGGNKSSGQFKMALVADYQIQHKLEVAYTKFLGRTEYGSGANPPLTSNGNPVKYTVGGGAFADRDYLSLTYTYNF